MATGVWPAGCGHGRTVATVSRAWPAECGHGRARPRPTARGHTYPERGRHGAWPRPTECAHAGSERGHGRIAGDHHHEWPRPTERGHRSTERACPEVGRSCRRGAVVGITITAAGPSRYSKPRAFDGCSSCDAVGGVAAGEMPASRLTTTSAGACDVRAAVGRGEVAGFHPKSGWRPLWRGRVTSGREAGAEHGVLLIRPGGRPGRPNSSGSPSWCGSACTPGRNGAAPSEHNNPSSSRSRCRARRRIGRKPRTANGHAERGNHG